MARIHEQSLISLEVQLEWQSREARHQELYLARRVNLWRDIFPSRMREALLNREIGGIVRLEYAAGEAVPGYDPKLVHRVPRSQFARQQIRGRLISLLKGRHYPRGMLGSLPGVFPQNYLPGRIIDLDDATMTVNLNHPLAGYDLSVQAKILDVADKVTETGGRLTCWMEEWADNGPGMQARHQGQPTQFGTPDGLRRTDETDDAQFYKEPRMVGHLDSQAGEFLKGVYEGALPEQAKVLDLMSSMQSHLPDNPALHVTGLGMNAAEMSANPRLAEHRVHDLNADPVLPFADGSFDAVVCSLSVEYLVRPQEVLNECARVLRPGGKLLVGFSNRWFPDKAVSLWMDLHEFERMGLVLDHFLAAQAFQDLQTVSIRNWWRPEDDPHINTTTTSDPVYVVMGTKS
ncbi:methyltransferase domain-containing protein [Desulfonatronum parangueonense]